MTAVILALAAGPALVAFSGTPEAEAADALHLTLLGTFPAADTVLTEAPDEVRLWFSEAPQMRGSSVRLADAGGELVPTTEAAPEDGDETQVFITPEAPLSAGTYTVHWRVIAQDGHAQNGEFDFQIE